MQDASNRSRSRAARSPTRRTHGGSTPIPLTIAGSDPTGGAGVEADLKTFLCHGLSGAAVITALTGQGPRGVHEVAPVGAKAVRRRIESVLDDLPIRGAKTGLLPSAAVVREVRRGLADRGLTVVVDPVIAPSRGAAFLDKAGVRALRDGLLPIATVVTPNLAELAALLGVRVDAVMRDPEGHARRLLDTGAAAVLLKGGHMDGPRSDDVLVSADRTVWLRGTRITDREHVHGTGCALSAAVLSGILIGMPVADAARAAKAWLRSAIRRAYQPDGSGDGSRRLWFPRGREDA